MHCAAISGSLGRKPVLIACYSSIVDPASGDAIQLWRWWQPGTGAPILPTWHVRARLAVLVMTGAGCVLTPPFTPSL
jgi:hypothetical protein